MARIAAALDADHADGFLHGGVDHTNDSGGKLIERKFGVVLLKPFLCDKAGADEIESEVAAEKARGLKAT